MVQDPKKVVNHWCRFHYDGVNKVMVVYSVRVNGLTTLCPLQLFVPADRTSSSVRTATVSTAADNATVCVIVQMAPMKSTAKTVSAFNQK